MNKDLIVLFTFCFMKVFSQNSTTNPPQQEIQKSFDDAECLKIGSQTCKELKCLGNLVCKSAENYFSKPELLCRDQSNIAVKWNTTGSLIFLVQYKTKNETEWKWVNKTEHSRIKLEELDSDTHYKIRLWGISRQNILFGPLESAWIKTLPSRYTPSPVVGLNVSERKTNGNSASVLVEWIPAEDLSCYYDLLAFPDSEYLGYLSYKVRKIDQLFQVVLSNLALETDYTLTIRSLSSDLQQESDAFDLEISTPSCLEAYNNSLEMCVPPKPANLKVEHTCYQSTTDENGNYTCDIEISWSEPELLPDEYIVSLHCNDLYNTSVSGEKTSALFYRIPFENGYFVVVMAHSKAGFSEPAEIGFYPDIQKLISSVSTSFWVKPASIALGSVFGVLILVALCYVQYKIRKTRQDQNITLSKYLETYKDKCNPSLNNLTAEYYIPEIINDEWQLNSEKIVLGKLLGEGAFGVVHKGFIKTGEEGGIEVAVKMLKGNPSTEEIRQFQHEIEIMKSVGSHPHLVSLIGCCSKLGSLGPFLVVEYCDKGDLQTYLHAVWEQISGQTMECYANSPYIYDGNSRINNNCSNKIYDLCDDALLESKDLLSFARQIVLGMEYLASLRVVHRDLAARNVLMCGNRIVKVADFGLSRDVYQDNIYTKTGTGKVPVKWMALESLSHQQYTIQSDVWSFGIVLWEIVTLGGNPYSTIPVGYLLEFLKNGYRMECPTNCSYDLYKIMQMCWKESPKDRPTFSDLRVILEKLMANETRYISLDVRY